MAFERYCACVRLMEERAEVGRGHVGMTADVFRLAYIRSPNI